MNTKTYELGMYGLCISTIRNMKLPHWEEVKVTDTGSRMTDVCRKHRILTARGRVNQRDVGTLQEGCNYLSQRISLLFRDEPNDIIVVSRLPTAKVLRRGEQGERNRSSHRSV